MSQLPNRIMKGFFWFAFASFLAASIPHVAYFFRTFEPQEASGQDTFYWGIAYAIAISIDVMIFLLSVTVAELQRQQMRRGTIVSVWAFILVLSAMSWFINWQYAKQFASDMLGHVTGIQLQLLWFHPTVGAIDPAIASMFQVFAIAYTYMADKIATGKARTAEELRAEADEEEARSREQARLDALRRQQRERRLAGLASTLQSVSRQVQQMRHTPGEEDTLQRAVQFLRQMPHLLAEDQAAIADALLKEALGLRRVEVARMWRMQAANLLAREQQVREGGADENRDEAEPLTLEETHRLLTPLHEQESAASGTVWQEETGISCVSIAHGKSATRGRGVAGESDGNDPEEKRAQVHAPGSAPDPVASRRTLTVKEAAALLGYSEKYIRELRKKGTLKTAPRNKNLLLVSSVQALMQARQHQGQKRGLSATVQEESA